MYYTILRKVDGPVNVLGYKDNDKVMKAYKIYPKALPEDEYTNWKLQD